MSTLQERLDRIRENFEAQAPPEALEIIHRSTDELRASGILDRIVRPGDKLPDFELLDTEGQPVRSAELRSRGPLIATFYRGLW